MIPFLPYEPDKGPYSASSTDKALNVIPIANGYGPFSELSDVSSSLGAQCYGAAYFRKSDGTFGIVAGTQTALYLFDSITAGWTAASGSSAPYSVRDGDMWSFARFGSGLYAAALDNAPQVYDVETGGNFSNVPGSPPQARFIWAAGDFLCLGYLKDGADEAPQDLMWSGLNDASWWTVGRKGCDRQTLPDGDEIVGGFPFIGGARIIQRKAKRAMVFNPQYIFSIQVLDATRGAVAPLSIVPIGAGDYVYLNEDGFYRGDGHAPIGMERVDRYFFADVDLDKLEEVQGAADPFTKMVWWRYQDGSGSYKMIGWNWLLDRWTRSDTAAQVLVAAVAPGISGDAADSFGSPDDPTWPASMDSRFWKGGRPTFGAFTSSNMLSLFTGSNAAATIETASTEMIPGSRAFLQGARLLSNADDYTMQVATADYHGGAEDWGTAVSPSTVTGMTPFRRDGRLHRFRATIAAGDVWTHAHGVDVEGLITRSGQR